MARLGTSIIVCGVLLGALSHGPAIAESELITLETRPGITQKVMVIVPDSKPTAVLVLYAGGVGTLSLGSLSGKPYVGDQSYSNNFLVRVRDDFAEKGFVVVLPDVPSDRQKLDYKYRLGDEQAKDIHGVVSYLKNRYGLPVWLVGTSASALTVANGAIAAGDKVSGVIFSASVTRTPLSYAVFGQYPNGVVSMDLPKIKVPALVIAHKEDGCALSPAQDAERIAARLTFAPKVEVKYFVGGNPPRSGPCDALSQHGFLGIEEQVVSEIVRFIRAY